MRKLFSSNFGLGISVVDSVVESVAVVEVVSVVDSVVLVVSIVVVVVVVVVVVFGGSMILVVTY